MAAGLAIGFYDGALGPGTGSFFVITLVGLLGYSFLEASAKARLANWATNLAALCVFVPQGAVLWKVGLVMGACNLRRRVRRRPYGGGEGHAVRPDLLHRGRDRRSSSGSAASCSAGGERGPDASCRAATSVAGMEPRPTARASRRGDDAARVPRLPPRHLPDEVLGADPGAAGPAAAAVGHDPRRHDEAPRHRRVRAGSRTTSSAAG